MERTCTPRPKDRDTPPCRAGRLLTVLALVCASATIAVADPAVPGKVAEPAAAVEVAGVAVAAPNAGPESGPRLVVPEREIDVGDVFRGDDAEARLELRNEGDETLHILRAKPG